MGCHTWFWAPFPEEKITDLQRLAAKSLEDTWKEEKDEDYRKMIGEDRCLTKEDYEFLKNQIETRNLPVIVDYSMSEINDCLTVIDGHIYYGLSLGCIEKDKITFIPTHSYFHDIFRIDNYPNWTIYSLRYLKRKLGKKWYNIPEENRKRISEFWKLYPGGVIDFG